jgi:hypothetical protein
MAAEKKHSDFITKQINALKAAKGKKVETGWFETQRYPADKDGAEGRLFSEVARTLEFGGTINHPGGTSYKQLDSGLTKFVKSGAAADGVTGPHTIRIPPRPFMRLAAQMFQARRKKMEASLASKIVAGKITADQAMAQVGDEMEGCILESIRDGNWEPNAKSTIEKKGFDSPLTESGKMAQAIVSKVT